MTDHAGSSENFRSLGVNYCRRHTQVRFWPLDAPVTNQPLASLIILSEAMSFLCHDHALYFGRYAKGSNANYPAVEVTAPIVNGRPVFRIVVTCHAFGGEMHEVQYDMENVHGVAAYIAGQETDFNVINLYHVSNPERVLAKWQVGVYPTVYQGAGDPVSTIRSILESMKVNTYEIKGMA